MSIRMRAAIAPVRPRRRSVRHPLVSACASAVESLERRQLYSATLESGVWQIRGDAGATSADTIVIEAVPGNAAMLQAVINSVVAGTASIADLRSIDINGGAGDDRITLRLDASTVSATIVVAGGDGNDRITGSSLSESFFGGTGHDRIETAGGNDTLHGDTGDDILSGGDGDDQSFGGDGRDILVGGWGTDHLDGGVGKDRLSGGHDVDELLGDRGSDNLFGGKGADAMDGGKGRDSVFAEKGIDVVGPIGSTTPVKKVGQDRLSVDDTHDPTPRQTTDAELKQWLIDAAVKQWAWAFDKPANPWIYHWGRGGEVAIAEFAGGGGVPMPTPGAAPTPPASPPVASPTAPGTGGTTDNGSKTNTQVAGVDEADLVETDGTYIYSLQRDQLIIADANPAASMSVVARQDFEGAPLGIYLSGNRLTMLTGSLHYWGMPVPVADTGIAISSIMPPFPEQDPFVNVTVFDVSNPAAPSVVETTKLDGSYNESRMIGDQLYVVMRNDAWVPEPKQIPNPNPKPAPEPPPSGGVEVSPRVGAPDSGYSDKVYESEAAYRARLESMTLADLLPGYESTAGGKTTSGELVAAPNAYVRDLGDDEIGQNLTSVVLLDIGDNNGGPTTTSTVAGYGNTIYASADALYLAGTTWSEENGESTQLFKFALEADDIPLVARGTVAGSVLNQFSMDESSDTFRIATNNGWRDESSNHLFVLEQTGDTLTTIGSIKNIAKGEDLQSARFDGDRAYIVTFRQIDPLFTIDLSDPRSPKIAGELKIPGFSSYLQPIGGGLLLGIGRDIDNDGVSDNGLQLSLFDVLDLSSPTRIAKYTIDNGYSEAEYDHHAFAYFSDQKILAVPVSSSGGVIDSDTGGYTQSLAVLKVDADAGAFTLLGKVNPGSEVRRSLRIGEVLFAVGSEHIQAVELQNPSVVIKTLATT